MNTARKIIFLDIDGVLNSDKFYKDLSQYIRWKKAKEEGKSRDEQIAIASIDPEAVKWVWYIINRTQASLVISSTWRSDNRLIVKFNYMGLPEFIDITPYTIQRHRGTEIQMWLDAHPEVDNYVILDDDTDMLDSQSEHFVHINYEEGLNEETANQAINILNNGV